MTHGVGRKKHTVVQTEVGNLLQDGSLFGLEGLSVGSGVGLLQILQDCFFTTRIQKQLVVMDASASLEPRWFLPQARNGSSRL